LDTATNPEEQRLALIDAAARLVGKPQPVPKTEQVFSANGQPELGPDGNPVYRIVRDPATGRVVPQMDALGNVVEVPMAYDEALMFVSTGLEEHEFFQTRTVPKEEVELATRMSSVVVDPAQIRPEHLVSTGGKLGLIDVVAGDAATAEERRERFELFEEEMKARGFDGFSPDVRNALEVHFKERETTQKKLSDLADYKAKHLENPAMRALRQTGYGKEADRRKQRR
jgi:hypothetical protein